MFPKIFFLNTKMKYPIRCYGGILIAIDLNGKFLLQQGEVEHNVSIALINEANLFQIKSSDVVIFYFPSALLEKAGINIFNHNIVIKNEVLLQDQLISLFNYYKIQELHNPEAHVLLDNILLNFAENTKTDINVSNDILKGILNYIHISLNNKITLKDISEQFYISTSNVSSLFKQYLNISFYEYVTSLRVAKSIYDLRNTEQNVEIIAFNKGYSSTNNYISHFKKYMGTTPKKYKLTPEESSFLTLNGFTNTWEDIQLYNFKENSIYSHTHIAINNDEITQPRFSYFNLIDIGSYKNLDFILNEKIFTYKNFNRYKVKSYIYIDESIDSLLTEGTEEQLLRFRKLLDSKFSIALKIKNIKTLDIITTLLSELHLLESEHLPSTNSKNGNLLILLNSEHLKGINIQNIKQKFYGINIHISVDITESFLKNESFINSQPQKLSPDYYHIDFKKIYKTSYDNSIKFKNIQSQVTSFLDSIDAHKNIIYLNHHLIYPQNVLKNIAEFLEISLYSKNFLAGASIKFNSSELTNNELSLFDKTENKTLFFHLGVMLLNFSKYNCFYGDKYIITKNMHSYNVLLYNSDHKITGTNEEYTHVFNIDASNITSNQSIIISEELLNNDYGTISGILSEEIKNIENFSDALKYKISQHNMPKLKISSHDFKEGLYSVKLPPKSIVMLTLYI